MSENDDIDEVELENPSRVVLSRPSLSQVKALVEFMQQHPELAQKKHRYMGHNKFNKMWIDLSNVMNSLDGAFKSTKGWIKFWSDKKRSLRIKKKHIEDGKTNEKLSPLEKKILDLSLEVTGTKKKRTLKVEPCNGNDEDSMDEALFSTGDLDFSHSDLNRPLTSAAEEQQTNIMEKLVTVMDQQTSAMSQMAQASLNNAKALERLAEASHIQALAVDRMSTTFESICGSVHDVRNAIMSIDYTMKRCYSATTTQHRQNSNIFS